MGLRDFTQGKGQFTQYYTESPSGTITSGAERDLLNYDGSGEIIELSFTHAAGTALIEDEDELKLKVDGAEISNKTILLFRMFTYRLPYFLICPYGILNRAQIFYFIKPGISFRSNITVTYTVSTAGNQTYACRFTARLY